MTIHSEGITDADLDRFEKVAEPIYRSTATAGKASRFQVSDLGMWIIRLVAEVRRLRVARPTSTEEEREVLARLVHDETGEAEEESGFVADAILAAFEVRLKAHTPTDDEQPDWRDKAWNAVSIGRITPTQGEPSDAVDLDRLEKLANAATPGPWEYIFGGPEQDEDGSWYEPTESGVPRAAGGVR